MGERDSPMRKLLQQVTRTGHGPLQTFSVSCNESAEIEARKWATIFRANHELLEDVLR